MKKLRKDQQICINACFANPIGRIIYPTGSGKSLVAQEAMRRIAAAEAGRPTVSVVFVPRIMLAKQWIKTSGEFLICDHGMRFNFLNINSGNLSGEVKKAIEEALYDVMGAGISPIISTTSSAYARREIKGLLLQGYHVIVICTYHSNEVLLQSEMRFDSVWYDECHFLASDNKFFGATRINSARKYYLTATPRFTDSDNGTGMNNESVYGPEIFSMSPREIIEIGAIVPPRIHIVGTSIQLDLDKDLLSHRDYDDLFGMVVSAFDRHKDTLKRESAEPDKIGAKLLVVCNGQLPLQGIFRASTFGKFRSDRPEVKIYGLSTKFGVYINGEHHPKNPGNALKEKLLYSLYRLNDNDDAIIFHVDMIAEGLDVPGITGVLPLRNLGKIKFLQNLGRSTRMHSFDRQRIDAKKIKPRQYSSYVKPHCYVILPYCLENRDDFLERNFDLVLALRSDYGFDPSEDIIVDILNPAQSGPKFDEDDLERQVRGLKKKVQNLLDGFYHQLEDDEFNEEEFLFSLKFRSSLTENEPNIVDSLSPI